MRIPDPTRFVPFLVRLGWASTRVANPDPLRASGRVFFFRGQALLFSRGFGMMCDELRRRGVWAEDLRCRGERWAVRQVIADYQEGRWRGPVVFVGHSCGGRSSLFAAEELRAVGIEVYLIVCLDVTLPPPVPANVRRAINLRRTRRRLYPAMPLVAAPGAAAVIDNVDLDAPDSPIDPRGICHVNITSRPDVREYVVGRILEAISGA
ncbi:MAG TPA: alpha/beta fold hydrolase [Gemmataceae bacterium]|nr:alpha/beta fold hydrolase [Gemmataceae bacterium]